MNAYEQLLDNDDVIVVEKHFKSKAKGLCKGNKIGISKTLSTNEKACVLAEELGHYYTSVGNILNMNDINNRKQEYRARMWAYNNRVGLMGIIKAYINGYTTTYEIAEYLEVTEEFFEDCIRTYTYKYGECTFVDNYLIRFIPNLQVYEFFEGSNFHDC